MQLEAGHDSVGGYHKARGCTSSRLNLDSQTNNYFLISQAWFQGLHRIDYDEVLLLKVRQFFFWTISSALIDVKAPITDVYRGHMC